MTKITEEIKKLLAEKKRMYREAVTYIDKAPKDVLKYHGFFWIKNLQTYGGLLILLHFLQ